MKMRKAFLAATIIALILIVILISIREYYVAIALGVGAFLIFRRELWYLAKHRRMPPFDERVQENIKKAARNSFIYLSVAITSLMLSHAIKISYIVQVDPIHIFSALLLSGGLVYLLGYIFYDRAEPKLREKELKKYWNFLRIAGIAFGAGIISAILHNVISGTLGVEEPVFFIIAVILSPGAIATGLIGSLVFFTKGLLRQQLPD